MITRRMKIRRHLRAVRVAALSVEERRRELREAEQRIAEVEERFARDAQLSLEPSRRPHGDRL